MSFGLDYNILFFSFNQSRTILSFGTEKGYRLYRMNLEEFENNDRKDSDSIYSNRVLLYDKVMDAGISTVELYFESNIIALCGGGKYPKYPKNKVILYDEEKSIVTNELVFNSFVKCVKMKKDLMFVLCETKIHVINLLSLQEVDLLDMSGVNQYCISKGIFSVNLSNDSNIICFPHQTKGYIKVKNYDNSNTILLNCHRSDIACLELSYDGKILATASTKGNVIRVFRTSDGMMLNKFRRGTDNTTVYYMSFDPNLNFLSVNCDMGMIYIFSLQSIKDKLAILTVDLNMTPLKYGSFVTKEVMRSDLNIEKSVFEKFGLSDSCEKHFSLFNVKNYKSISCIVNNSRTLVVVSGDGMYYEATIEKDICLKKLEISLG